MYTLDALGYRGAYDVYDHTGMGNTNNQLGSRAQPIQAQHYNLIAYDAGVVNPTGTINPDGSDLDAGKVPQQQWFIQWLSLASSSEAGFMTFWMIGANALEEWPTAPLYNVSMQVTLASADQGLNANPDVLGIGPFTFDQGAGSVAKDFTGDEYSLAGGCPASHSTRALGRWLRTSRVTSTASLVAAPSLLTTTVLPRPAAASRRTCTAIRSRKRPVTPAS
jgi:hypothetical protein